ncbi:MAG TPA: 50S ribosomal protein L10 [Acidimicrobiales bacterium]
MTDTSVAEAEPVARGRSAEPRPEKVAVVEEVRGKLSSAGAAILTEYRGLKVSELQVLRRSLRQAGGEYKIYKNTLVRFATRELGIDGLEGLLEGPTAIAFADADVPAVAKALRDFSRTNPLLVVKGGVMGSSVLSARDATALADIPSRDVLLAQLAGLMAAPLQQFAGLLQALPRNFAYGLKALIDQGGAPGAPAPEPGASEPAAAPSAETAAEPVPADVAEPAPAETEAEPVPADVAEPAAAETAAEPAPAEPASPAAAAEATPVADDVVQTDAVPPAEPAGDEPAPDPQTADQTDQGAE